MIERNIKDEVLRHYAQNTKTRERYIIIALEVEGEPNYCLCIPYDKLGSTMRSELIKVINSHQCQTAGLDCYKFLQKNTFMEYPKHDMLHVLKVLQMVLKVPSDNVTIAGPNNTYYHPRKILEFIKIYEERKRIRESSADKKVIDAMGAIDDKTKVMLQAQDEKISALTGLVSQLMEKLSSVETIKKGEQDKLSDPASPNLVSTGNETIEELTK